MRLRISLYLLILVTCLGLYGVFGTATGFRLLLRGVSAWTPVQASASV